MNRATVVIVEKPYDLGICEYLSPYKKNAPGLRYASDVFPTPIVTLPLRRHVLV